jgi:hypothetical protein
MRPLVSISVKYNMKIFGMLIGVSQIDLKIMMIMLLILNNSFQASKRVRSLLEESLQQSPFRDTDRGGGSASYRKFFFFVD